MLAGERKKCEAHILALLDQNPQVSELYLQLLTAFESLPALASFLLFHLINRLFKSSQQLAFLFSLCQLCEDPLLAEALGVYWPHRPSDAELMLMYELVAEKNFREFIALPISDIEAKARGLHSARKLPAEGVAEMLERLIAAPAELPPCEPVRLVNICATDPASNAFFFEQTGDNEELLVRQAALARFSPAFLPQPLLPLPAELDTPLLAQLEAVRPEPLLNCCLNTQALLAAPLQLPATLAPADRESVLQLITSFPHLLDARTLTGRAEALVSENPAFAVEVLTPLARSRPELFRAFLNEVVERRLLVNNAMMVASRLAADTDADMQDFLDRFIQLWFESCAGLRDKSQMRRLYLCVRFFEGLLSKKRFDPFVCLEKWLFYCNQFGGYAFVERLRQTLAELGKQFA